MKASRYSTALARFVLALVVLVYVAGPYSALAQDAPVQTRVLAETQIDVSSTATISVFRMYLTDLNRSESLLLEGTVLMTVEDGSAKIWTRRGATIDGNTVQEATATLYVEKGATFSAPPETRFRVRSTSCEPLRLLIIIVSD